MNEFDQKTTSISNELWRPLEVEWFQHLRHYKVVDGVSIQSPQQYVALVHPGRTSSLGSTRLLNMSPQTALNLLAWLEQERETLQSLAESEATSDA